MERPDALKVLLNRNPEALITSIYQARDAGRGRAAILALGHGWFEVDKWKHRTVAEFIEFAEKVGPTPVMSEDDRKQVNQDASDLTLGRHVRALMELFPKQYANDVMCAYVAAEMLSGVAHKLNGEFEAKIPELFYKGKSVGAWIVTAKKL
jgi:hypothetical protein